MCCAAHSETDRGVGGDERAAKAGFERGRLHTQVCDEQLVRRTSGQVPAVDQAALDIHHDRTGSGIECDGRLRLEIEVIDEVDAGTQLQCARCVDSYMRVRTRSEIERLRAYQRDVLPGLRELYLPRGDIGIAERNTAADAAIDDRTTGPANAPTRLHRAEDMRAIAQRHRGDAGHCSDLALDAGVREVGARVGNRAESAPCCLDLCPISDRPIGSRSDTEAMLVTAPILLSTPASERLVPALVTGPNPPPVVLTCARSPIARSDRAATPRRCWSLLRSCSRRRRPRGWCPRW